MKEQTQTDDMDRALLQLLQDDFPVTACPWDDIGDRLQIPAEEVLERITRLSRDHAIRSIGPVIEASAIGLTASTLMGMEVPEEEFSEVVRIINASDAVSHNYRRNHRINLWFTITCRDREELDRVREEIIAQCDLNGGEVLDLPVKKRFKIDVRFPLLRGREAENG
jgi:DNA-binding Lrp family transcriptional regulator